MGIILLLLLGFIVYVIVRNLSVLRKVYLIFKAQRDFSKRYYEQQQEAKTEHRESQSPPLSSVDKIRGANMDLNGGEYIDYEDVK